MGMDPKGGGALWAQLPRKFFVTPPFSLPENEEIPLLRHSKDCLNMPCKRYSKIAFSNKGHSCMLVKPSSY